MISYCIAVYRPVYARQLIAELLRKTSVPFEILIWLNADDAEFADWLANLQHAGRQVRMIGRTPENIGMTAYRELFAEARYDLITQIDDDVICVSRGIAQMAGEIFARFPRVRQLTADVWQDEYTSGARPDMSAYRLVDREYGLYDGPIDGWFSIYHRSILPRIPTEAIGHYTPIGGLVKRSLERGGLRGLLCRRMQVFHVVGPEYASYFGTLDFEIRKYRRLGRRDIVFWYQNAREHLPVRAELASRIAAIRAHFDDPILR